MSAARISAAIGSVIGHGVLGSAVNAACGAASGAIGASILSGAGHAGRDVLESTQIGAAGGALLGGAMGMLSGGLRVAGIFGNSGPDEDKKPGCAEACGKFTAAVAVYTGIQVLDGMLGYGMFKGAGWELPAFGSVVADMAVGGAVGAVPVTIGLACLFCCCAVPLGLAIAATNVKLGSP